MIVETTPTGPRGPIRRTLRTLGLAIPLVLLAGVVGVGVLGPHPDPEATSGSPAPSEAPAAASPPPGVTPAPATVAISAPITFPVFVANLPVQRIPAVLAANLDHRDGAVVAVTGYLRAWVDPQACSNPIPGLPGEGCTRLAFLTEAPWATGRSEGLGGIGEHLSGIVPPGVSIPDSTVGLVTADTRQATPVVVIGRFGSAGDRCLESLRGCDEPFVIERVTWVAGQDLAMARQISRGLTADDSDPMAREPDMSAGRALGPITTLLRMVLVEPDALLAVDAAAAAALVDRGAGPAGPIWYVRGLDVPYQPPPGPPYARSVSVVRWAVVDRATGTVLAAGDAGASMRPKAAPGAG